MNNTALARSMLIYAICLPLAIVLGYIITDPLRGNNPVAISLVFFFLLLPLLLRWYHAWLIVIWNMPLVFSFLPGMFPGWVPVSCVGFAVAVGHYILNRERKFLYAPSVSWSLIVLAIVVLVTAKFRGGLGFRVLGNEAIGGKRYLWIWVAILAYFALISQPIPPQKRKLYTTLFLLGSGASVIAFLARHMGPAGNVVGLLFPSAIGSNQMQGNPMAIQNLEQYSEVASAFVAPGFALVAYYGIERSLDLGRIWRPILFFAAFAATLFGGFRSIVILVGLLLVFVFFFEGLFRSRLMPIAVLGLFLIGGVTVTFSDRLPLSVQRCLTIFPIKLDPIAKLSAQGSSEWRLEIWRSLLPQVPQYLFLGKGLTFDSNDMAMYQTLNNQKGGEVGGGFTLASDYHNGPLSVIIPFGIWGCIAFIWFLVAGTRVLWANYKYGDPEIKTINTFFLSYFIAKIISFLLIFGGFYSDLVGFVGIVGFSISLNNGVAKPVVAPARPQMVFNRFRPLPDARPVTNV